MRKDPVSVTSKTKTIKEKMIAFERIKLKMSTA